MTPIDRRTLLRNILPGAVAAAAGVTAIAAGGTGMLVPPAKAMPLAIDKTNPLDIDELFQPAQMWVAPPPRRRWRRRRVRRWTCWWWRGRRRCGWRWVWI